MQQSPQFQKNKGLNTVKKEKTNSEKAVETEAEAAEKTSEAAKAAEPAVTKVGHLLKEMRLQKGQKLPDIAKKLCIRKFYLEAIEESRYEDLPPFPYGVGFIRSYADPPTQEEVEANVYSSVTGDEPQIPLNPIKLVFSYKNSVDIPQDYCLRNYPATPEEKRGIVVFDSLARAHHDTEYKRRGEVFCSCLFVRTDRIDVFSDTDYDAAHPAGTPLNDIVDIRFSSGEDYLQSGYTKGKYLGKTTRLPIRYNSFYKTYDVSRSVIDLQESLEEFNRIKRKLIAFNFAFEFRSDPSHTAEHNFTIVYRNEQGLTLSGQVGPVLLKGTE